MSNFVLSRFVPAAVFACLVAGLPACGSTSSKDGSAAADVGQPQRVRLVDYVSGADLELVNESHFGRVETYSTTRKLGDTARKVATDEVLDEVVDQFRSGGFFARATPGTAPTAPPPGVTKAIEVEEDGRIVHWTGSRDVPREDRELFVRCTILFSTVFTNTYALQSVDRPPDWEGQNPQPKKKGQ